MLSVKEVTQRVPLGPDAIYRAISRGELQAFKRCGRVMIDEADLAAWVEAGRVRSERQGGADGAVAVAARPARPGARRRRRGRMRRMTARDGR
jgi:excisionase family DNA binding protein